MITTQPTKTKQQKIDRAIDLHFRAQGRGKQHYDAASKHLQRAIKLGLKPGDIINASGKPFRLLDNVIELNEKNAIYRPARMPRFELKKASRAAVEEAAS